MAGRFSVEAQFRAIDGLTKPINKMQRRINKFTSLSSRKFRKLNKSIGDFSGRALSTGAAVSVGALSLALVDGARKAIEFEQTLVNAAAKFPEGIKKGTKEFEALEKAARKTGAETEFSATQAAEGLNFLAMAGFNAEQSIAALPFIVDLATASQVDLATASDIATDSLGAFGLATKDPIQLAKNLARVNDVLAKTVTTTNTDMSALFETIKSGGPVATSAGASIETYAALTGKLANAGIKGEKAGTTLKNVFLSLAAVTPKAANALALLGVTTQDQEGNLRDVIDIFEDINKGIQREKLGTAETAAVLKNIFGRIPIAGVNVLLKEGADSLRKYRKELEGATGASGEMADQMRDTLKGQINSLLSAFEGLQITIFKLNDGAFGGYIDKITEAIRMLDSWINANQDLSESIVVDIIDTIFGVLQIIGLVILAFTIWKLLMFSITAVIIGFNVAILIFKGTLLLLKGVIIALRIAQLAWNLALFLNPIVAIVAAIVALIVIGILLIANWDTVSAFFTDLWDDIGTAFSSGIDFVMGLINPFQMTLRGIGGLFEKFGIVFNADKADTENDNVTAGGESPSGSFNPQVITPAAGIQRVIEENLQTSTAELLIRDESGRAELKDNAPVPGVKITMSNSGGV
jgi:TP901 family phage tail tape measure protein